MSARRIPVNKILNILKLILVLVTCGFLYFKYFHAYHLSDLLEEFSLNPDLSRWLFLAGAVFLAIPNILLESLKWKILIGSFEYSGIKDAVKAVCSGITLGIITPNQIGEFAGRLLYVQKAGKWNGTLITAIGNTAQLIYTIVFGMMSVLWFAGTQGRINAHQSLLGLFALSGLAIIVMFMFINLNKMNALIRRINSVQRFGTFHHFESTRLVKVLFVAAIRYLVIMIQYLLVAKFLDVHTGIWVVFGCVNACLLVQTFVPSFILLDLGIRGASSLWFFGHFTNQHAEVLLLTYTIWSVNILLPGLFGLFNLVRWKQRQ